MRIIILGAGEVGFYIAKQLVLEGNNVCVIDKEPSALERIRNALDVQVFEGEGQSPAMLEKAEIKEAGLFFAVTSNDETNLVACLIANLIKPSIKKLARIRNADYDNYHDLFMQYSPNIDKIINPEIEIIKSIEMLIKTPAAVEIGEFFEGKLIFMGIQIKENSKIINKSLIEFPSEFKNKTPLVAALIRDEKLIIPKGNDKILENDLVYFISEKSNLDDTLQVFVPEQKKIKRIIVVGGGRISKRLVKELSSNSYDIKLIEKDREKCKTIAEELDNVVIVNGDASKSGFLKEENVNNSDVVISLTNSDETNILVSLLSKKMGALSTITKLDKFSYLSLMSNLGLERVVSLRLSIIDKFLNYSRKGRVFSPISIYQNQTEVFEITLRESSKFIDKSIKDIQFPESSLIIAIISKEKCLLPTGNYTLNVDDTLIIFSIKENIKKIEKILKSKK